MHRLSEFEVLALPLSEYRRKFQSALQLIQFEKTGDLDLLDGDAMEDKYDREFAYLKEIGYL